MKLKSLALGVISSTLLAAAPNDEHMANKNFDPKKQPVLNEPVLSTEGKAVTLPLAKPDCSKEQVWTVQSPYKITVTATKDEKLPVPGNFDRIVGQLFVDKKTQKLNRVEGTIDLLSFNSGVPDRDRRIQRYILGAEKNPLATFNATFPKNTQIPVSGSSISSLKSTLNFANETFNVEMQMKTERIDAATIRLSTVEPATLNYVRDSMSGGLQKLLELCNHKFLAKAVKLNLEMNLKAECPAN
jgi:polyisoprenoid-binding protein YceI